MMMPLPLIMFGDYHQYERETVIAWSNLAVLMLSSVFFTVFYVMSVKPASLERLIGPRAYDRCKWYRVAASIFMMLAAVNYLVYYHYPLAVVHDWTGIPRTFSWPYRVSVVIATVIGLPCGCLMWIGMRDAGEETMTPRKEHTMYQGGIYEHMRHPQAVGEFPLWWVFAFLAHSPFLVVLSFVYIPVWWYFSVAEEYDLILRYGSEYERYRERVGWFPKNMRIISSFCQMSVEKKSE